jgi:hypothetical protein
LKEFNPNENCKGEFFGGLDLAQTRDYCVLSVVERLNDKLYLRHLKIFQQPTLYATVLGYLKALQDRWGGFEKIRVDFTREGPSIIADMETAGIYPLLSWERPYRGEICIEMNVERYDLLKDGNVGFSHPTGTHDDVFWSLALAVYSTVEDAA